MYLAHAASLILIAALAWLTWIDSRTLRLPDIITLPLIVAGLAINLVAFGVWRAPLAGAVFGYGALVALETGYRALRGRDGLGRGDAKLLAAAGAWCGAWLLPPILLVASLSAIGFVLLRAALERRMPDPARPLPFGPWIALGFALAWIYRAYGPGLIPAY